MYNILYCLFTSGHFKRYLPLNTPFTYLHVSFSAEEHQWYLHHKVLLVFHTLGSRQKPGTKSSLGCYAVSSCHLFGGPFRGVTFGSSGVSIGKVRMLRVDWYSCWGASGKSTDLSSNHLLIHSNPLGGTITFSAYLCIYTLIMSC